MHPRTLLLVALVACAACTPTRNRLQPYRTDPQAAGDLASRASRVCIARRGANDQPPHPFTTDGCSLFPDGKWAACCIEHDIAYWCGGTSADREKADRALAECVGETQSDVLGELMYLGVRVGGMPWQPFPFRWAYGWEGIHGYDRP